MKIRTVAVLSLVVVFVLALGATFVLAQGDDEPAEPPFGPGMETGKGFFGDHGRFPGRGLKGHGRFARGMAVGLETIADVLDMTPEAVREELATGISIAELAENHDTDVQVVIDALVAQGQERLQTAVDNGRLTQEQADAMLERMTTAITQMVEKPMPAGGAPGGFGFGRGGRFHAGQALDIVAQELGMASDEVREAVAAGSTIADLAESQNVDTQTIIDALLAKPTAMLETAVAGGRITQEQADTALARISEAVTTFINETPPLPDPGQCDGFGPGAHGQRGFGRGFHPGPGQQQPGGAFFQQGQGA